MARLDNNQFNIPQADAIFGDRQHFELLFRESAVGLNLCRMSDGLWLDSNPAFLNMIGYSKEEADGKLSYWDLTPREYDEQEAVQLEALMETGKYGPYEKEFIRKDGSRVPVRLNGFITRFGDESFIWSIIEDNTEKKRLEAEIESERLNALQAAKLATIGEMAAGFAHEINNPLAIIDGYVENLPRIIEQGDAGEIEDTLNRIHTAVERAAKIVRGLRTFARVEDRSQLNPVSLALVVQETLDLCRPRIQGRGVAIEILDDLDYEVTGRRLELSQVIMNLVNNAFDAIKSTVDHPLIQLSCTQVEDRLKLRVIDNGPGISSDIVPRLFDPFFTTKPVGEGTGLGLSISNGVMKDFGGSLDYELWNGKTSFVLTLDLSPGIEQVPLHND